LGGTGVVGENDDPPRRTNMNLVAAVLGGLAAIVAAGIYFYSDYMGRQHQVVLSYSESAYQDFKVTEVILDDILSGTKSAEATIDQSKVEELRQALIALRASSDRLAWSVGELENELSAYQTSMVELISAAKQTTGPKDAKSLWQAIALFYVEREKFHRKVSEISNSLI
jgi:hypothetical protein